MKKLQCLDLEKMGGNMATRLIRNGINVVGFDMSSEMVAKLEQEENLIPASSVQDAINQLEGQRIIWMMLPAGEVTEKQIG